MWFTETPWPPMLILLVAAMGCGWMWVERRQRSWLAAAIGCAALIAGVWAYERAVITPREQIHQHILDLAQAFQDRREDEFFGFISLQADDVRQQAKTGWSLVADVENLRITATDVTLMAAGSRAKADFRANGRVSAKVVGDIGHQATRWEMTWRQEGGQWKIIALQRLDPITGEPVGLASSQY